LRNVNAIVIFSNDQANHELAPEVNWLKLSIVLKGY